MQPPRPKHRGAVTTTSATDTLPKIDPVKREIAAPLTPTNNTELKAGEYLSPPSPTQADNLPPPIGKLNNVQPTTQGFASTAPANNATGVGEARSKLSDAGINNLKDVSQLVTSDDEKVSLDFNQVQNRVERAFGIPGTTEELNASTKNAIADAAAEQFGANDAGVVIDGVDKVIQGKDINDARSITQLVNRVAGASDTMAVLDLGAQAALIQGVSGKLIEWGAPDLLDKLIDSMGDVKAKQAMWEDMAVRAASQGDVSMTRHYGEKMGAARRMVIWKDVVSNLLQRYRKPKDDSSLKNLGNALLSVLALYNTDWNKDPYDINIVCLHYYIMANDDAKECLLRTSHRVDVQAARQITLTNIDNLILTMFPNLGMI